MRLPIVLAAVLLPLAAEAHDYEKGGIHVGDAWARAPIGLGTSTAGYLEIFEMDGKGDRLIGARSEMADRVELHTHTQVDGVMRMRPLEALEIKPMGGGDLQPGGHHLMIMGLKQTVKPGDRIPVTLIFEKAGEMPVRFTVRAKQ
ncbi:MAG: copper chaperone PCu(A)C [Minwuia sp.]|uniref:copper chaperone PCu(A)C n=1 Tax=Minwuia sp. TaxID=2493630 RepID=UPI003A8C402D